MDCTGVYPIALHGSRNFFEAENVSHACFMCRERNIDPVVDQFCEGIDSYLHRRCVMAFLDSPIGRRVVELGYAVIVLEVLPHPPAEPSQPPPQLQPVTAGGRDGASDRSGA